MRWELMRTIVALLAVLLPLLTMPQPAVAIITCRDQFKACIGRKNQRADCLRAQEVCYKTGRWIGPDGIPRPVTRK